MTKEPDVRELAPLSALDAAGISYIRLTHEPLPTMELCEGIGSDHGAAHCKNLFLANRSGNRFCLLLMRPEKVFRTSEVSKKLGLPRMGFASGEQLKTVLGLEQGSVSILSLVNECAREAYLSGRLVVAIDEDLFEWERILVHPNVNTASLVVRMEDVVKLLDGMGIEYRKVSV